MASSIEKAKQLFISFGGIMRTGEAIASGIHPGTLYAMRDSGDIEQMSRGVFRLTKLPYITDIDITIVSKRIPNGVICLISALKLHELTTQIPHIVHIAIPRTSRYPVIDSPSIHAYRFSKDAFEAGIETINDSGVNIRIYCAEKTLADCFKYRNKIGLSVFLEALKIYRTKPETHIQKVLEFARLCRVENGIIPYLEML